MTLWEQLKDDEPYQHTKPLSGFGQAVLGITTAEMDMERLIPQTASSPAFVGTIDKQREHRRQLVKAQANALRELGYHGIADRYEANALRVVNIVSFCDGCKLELIGDDDCPRCSFPSPCDYDVASEGDEN